MRFDRYKQVVCAGLIAVPGLVLADEAAEQMVQEALPLMYHTCVSVVEEADGDHAYIYAVVEKMTALSLYNRHIDIADHATTDDEKVQLRETFVAALRQGCADDKDALLGGVVDAAVKSTLGL